MFYCANWQLICLTSSLAQQQTLAMSAHILLVALLPLLVVVVVVELVIAPPATPVLVQLWHLGGLQLADARPAHRVLDKGTRPDQRIQAGIVVGVVVVVAPPGHCLALLQQRQQWQ